MLSVKNNTNTIIIKNSKFITIIYQIDNIEEIDKYLKEVKNQYKNATHYCYAYILDSTSKCSDDGEPSGTAGIPMLEILKKNNLDHVLCIVVRYFGKILLGAGGLVRAYSRSVKECLENNIIELKEGLNIKITFSYNNLKKIDYILNNCIINKKTYNKDIIYDINITKEKYNELTNSNICTIEIIKSIYI
ncbi:MAG: YigZ family protein [Bacilli bacterium]|nr:YigZ family protein [Bacilli bacterium]